MTFSRLTFLRTWGLTITIPPPVGRVTVSAASLVATGGAGLLSCFAANRDAASSADRR